MESAWTPPPWGGGTIDPEKEANLHVLPHKFGSYVSKGVCTN